MNAQILPERSVYQPGEAIKGTVTWTSEKSAKTAELRLFWHTRGKGDRDAETAGTVVFELPQPSDSREFLFRAPDFPPSFSGKLISLLWGLELVLEPGGTEAVELVIAPGGQELVFDRPEWIEGPEFPKLGALRFNQ